MGLDWMAFKMEEDEEWGMGQYRGKGVAYDPNIEELSKEERFKGVENQCYGKADNVRKFKEDGKELTRPNIMTAEQKQAIESALEYLLEQPEETINWTDAGNDSYQEWIEWMKGALEFLQGVDYDDNEYIWCWF